MAEALTPTTTDPAAPAPAPAAPVAPAPQLSFGQKVAASMAAAAPADPPPEVQDQGPVATPTLKDQLAKLGFADVKDDAEAAQRLVAAYRQQQDQVAAQLREAIEQVKPAGEFQPALPPAAPTDKQNRYKAPPIDKQRVAEFRTGEGWKDGTPDDVKQQYAAWQRHRDSFADSLLEDTESTLADLIDSRAEAKVRELLNQAESQKSYQSTIDKIVADNPWVYDRDPVTGQPRVDSTTRSYALSADGQLINSHFTALLQSGLPVDRAWHYANLEFQAAKGQRANGHAQVAQINAEQKEALLARANGGALPQRGASLPTPANNGHTQNARLRPGQRLLAQMQRDGISAT